MEGTVPESSTLERVLVASPLRVGALAALLSASANSIVLAITASFLVPWSSHPTRR